MKDPLTHGNLHNGIAVFHEKSETDRNFQPNSKNKPTTPLHPGPWALATTLPPQAYQNPRLSRSALLPPRQDLHIHNSIVPKFCQVKRMCRPPQLLPSGRRQEAGSSRQSPHPYLPKKIPRERVKAKKRGSGHFPHLRTSLMIKKSCGRYHPQQANGVSIQDSGFGDREETGNRGKSGIRDPRTRIIDRDSRPETRATGFREKTKHMTISVVMQELDAKSWILDEKTPLLLAIVPFSLPASGL